MIYTDFLWICGTLAAVLSSVAYLIYMRDMLRGHVRPMRSCWLIWSALSMVSFLSNVDKGATFSLMFVGVQAFKTLLIFGLSLRWGYGSLVQKGEALMLLGAGAGLVLWSVTENSAYAMMISIGISLIGGLATLRKAYLLPASESMLGWWWSFLGSVVALVAVGSWNLVLMAYPMYLVVLSGAILTALMLGARRDRLAGGMWTLPDQDSDAPLAPFPPQRGASVPFVDARRVA